jgi:hypothetical protein
MKKLQMIAVLILALLFVSACLPEDEDEEEFLNDDRTDTVPDENSDTTDDTLPDGQQNTEPTNPTNEPTNQTEPTNSTEPTEPTSDPTEPTTEPTTEPSDDSDTPSTDNDDTPLPDNDSEEPSSDDDIQPAADDDQEILNDEDSENPSDNDLTDNDIQTDYDIETDDDDADSTPDEDDDADTELPECSSGITTVCKDSSSTLIWSTLSSSQYKLADAENYCNTLNEGGYPAGSWKLPNINDLKTLILNCDRATNPEQCKVSDPDCLLSGTTCYDNMYCNNTNVCKSNSSGSHSKLGDNMHIWSSSKCSDNNTYAFMVMFLYGTIGKNKTNNPYHVRCIKK